MEWRWIGRLVQGWHRIGGLVMDQQNDPRFASDWEIGAVFELCVEWQMLCAKSSSVETSSLSI